MLNLEMRALLTFKTDAFSLPKEHSTVIGEYSDNWEAWIDIARHQHYKDRKLFIPLLRWFSKEANILEIGAGVGQLSTLVKEAGFGGVVASDVEARFIEYMGQSGLKSKFVDAMDIKASSDGILWDVIFSQGLSPLVSTDMKVVEQVYRSIYDVLVPGGRFLFIFPRSIDTKRYSRLNDHRDIYLSCGFSEIISFRQQVMPAIFYKFAISMLVERPLASLLGTRDVVILAKRST